jgi:hypothetical protein
VPFREQLVSKITNKPGAYARNSDKTQLLKIAYTRSHFHSQPNGMWNPTI